MSTTIRNELGTMEFEYTWHEWKEFKYLMEMSGGSVAAVLQTQIEYGNIKTLDEVIQWAHLGERILKGMKEPQSKYNRGFINSIRKHIP